MFLSKLDSLKDALKLIENNQKVMDYEEIPLKDAHKRVLAEDIISFYVFSSFDKSVIFPVDNKWGKLGWTIIDLNIVSDDVFTDALMTAYCEVAPKKLADLVR